MHSIYAHYLCCVVETTHCMYGADLPFLTLGTDAMMRGCGVQIPNDSSTIFAFSPSLSHSNYPYISPASTLPSFSSCPLSLAHLPHPPTSSTHFVHPMTQQCRHTKPTTQNMGTRQSSTWWINMTLWFSKSELHSNGARVVCVWSVGDTVMWKMIYN